MSKLNFRIHPAIGMARVGNSSEYYLSPETIAGLKENEGDVHTGGLPIKKNTENSTITSSDIRDGSGALKRQAARFKIYQYTLDSDTETYPMNLPADAIQEIQIGSTVENKKVIDIIWTVHVANKKANTFVLVEDPNEPEGISSYQNGQLPPIRNTDIDNPNAPQPADPIKVLNDPQRVRKLTIDPGPRVVKGSAKSAVNCDADSTAQYWHNNQVSDLTNYPKSFPNDSFTDLNCSSGAIDTLGEIQTDQQGRLIFSGGYGKACSWGGAKLGDDVNNDQWFDDACDGPVTAVLAFDDGSYQTVQGHAWVTATDPAYAPQTLNIVPLFDDIYNAWVMNLDLSPELYKNGQFQTDYKPYFDDALNPVFQSVALQKWNINLNQTGIDRHDKVGNITASTDPSTTGVMRAVRDPNDSSQFSATYLMPLALGDANESFLAVTETQYFCLSQWNSNQFKAGSSAVLNAGEKLDKNTLMNCLGGRFSPGIDLTFIVRQPEMYVQNWANSGTGPFRVNPANLDYTTVSKSTPLLTEGYVPLHNGASGIEPGDLSKFMAIPWHTDYNSCATHLPSPNPATNNTLFWSWPAQRPVAVYPAAEVAANGGQLVDKKGNQVQAWSVRGAGTSTNQSVAQDWGRFQVREDMLSLWQDIGVVIQGNSIDPKDSGPADASYYLEVASLLKEGSQATNPVEPFPNMNNAKPKT